MSIYNIIKSLQDAKGSLAKQAILNENAGNVLLKNFMQATYNPALSYYQSSVLTFQLSGGRKEFAQDDIDFVVEVLAKREITGAAAIAALIARIGVLDAEGRALLTMLIKRSIGGSVGDTMVLKAWPGLFFCPPYMRCAGMSPKVKEEYAAMPYFCVQTKYDGSFGYLSKPTGGGEPSLFTRAGSYYPASLAIKMASTVPEAHVVMGEMLVFEGGVALSRKVSNGMLNSLLQGGEESGADIRMVIWDMVTEAEFKAGLSNTPYRKRLGLLDWFIGDASLSIAPTKRVTSLEQAFALNQIALQRGEEGTVWKNTEGIWKNSSSGTHDAVKVKIAFQAEYVVVGKYEGEGKAKGMLGGFNIATSDGKIACNVGSGFSDKQRKEYWEEDTLGWIITLDANDVITRSGSTTESLFLPIFIERRLDKTVADCRKRVLEQLQSAKE